MLKYSKSRPIPAGTPVPNLTPKTLKTLKKYTLLLLFRLCLIVQCYEQKIITSKNITKSVVICTSR